MNHLECLLQKIGTTNQPELVPVIPESYATIDGCFYNVKDKVSKDGGTILSGWKLMNTPFVLEAERHAVWVSPTNEIIDVTPNQEQANHISFIRDESEWEYNGEFTDNIRLNRTESIVVDDYIEIAENITFLYQTGKRQFRDTISISPGILGLIQFLERDNTERMKFLFMNGKIDSPVTYQFCHGNNIKMMRSEIINRLNQ